MLMSPAMRVIYWSAFILAELSFVVLNNKTWICQLQKSLKTEILKKKKRAHMKKDKCTQVAILSVFFSLPQDTSCYMIFYP